MSKSFADSCKDKLDTLINHELIVNGSYIVLKQILNLQEINNELLNISVSFYRTVVNNCVSTIFIELAKEYDTFSKTLNLRSLLSDIKHNLHQLHDKSFYFGASTKPYLMNKPTEYAKENEYRHIWKLSKPIIRDNVSDDVIINPDGSIIITVPELIQFCEKLKQQTNS